MSQSGSYSASAEPLDDDIVEFEDEGIVFETPQAPQPRTPALAPPPAAVDLSGGPDLFDEDMRVDDEDDMQEEEPLGPDMHVEPHADTHVESDEDMRVESDEESDEELRVDSEVEVVGSESAGAPAVLDPPPRQADDTSGTKRRADALERVGQSPPHKRPHPPRTIVERSVNMRPPSPPVSRSPSAEAERRSESPVLPWTAAKGKARADPGFLADDAAMVQDQMEDSREASLPPPRPATFNMLTYGRMGEVPHFIAEPDGYGRFSSRRGERRSFAEWVQDHAEMAEYPPRRLRGAGHLHTSDSLELGRTTERIVRDCVNLRHLTDLRHQADRRLATIDNLRHLTMNLLDLPFVTHATFIQNKTPMMKNEREAFIRGSLTAKEIRTPRREGFMLARMGPEEEEEDSQASPERGSPSGVDLGGGVDMHGVSGDGASPRASQSGGAQRTPGVDDDSDIEVIETPEVEARGDPSGEDILAGVGPRAQNAVAGSSSSRGGEVHGGNERGANEGGDDARGGGKSGGHQRGGNPVAGLLHTRGVKRRGAGRPWVRERLAALHGGAGELGHGANAGGATLQTATLHGGAGPSGHGVNAGGGPSQTSRPRPKRKRKGDSTGTRPSSPISLHDSN